LIEDSALELEEIGIDADPMVRVFPVRRFKVITLEGR